MSYVYPCPTDLKEGERIEIYETHLDRSFYATVYDTDYNGVLSVTLDHMPGMVYSVDPSVSKWRRASDFTLVDRPVTEYGAICSDKYCLDRFYPYAENKPNWKCWSCRNR